MDERLASELSTTAYALERASRYLSAFSEMRDALRRLEPPGNTLTLNLNLFGAEFELETEDAKFVLNRFLGQADIRRAEYNKLLAQMKDLAAKVNEPE